MLHEIMNVWWHRISILQNLNLIPGFFFSDHDNNPDSRGACGQIKTLHLQMTQTDFLHEVQLKCVLETVNPRGPPKVLEDVATIKVVPSKFF